MDMLKELTLEEFARRVEGGARTPVFREFLADRETPVSVLTRVSDEESVFLRRASRAARTAAGTPFSESTPTRPTRSMASTTR